MSDDRTHRRVGEDSRKDAPVLGSFPQVTRRVRQLRELSLSFSIPNIGVFRNSAALARHIDTCIVALDRVQSDPDREPDADLEPSLGWPPPGVQAPAGEGEDIED